jgi:hypothetical protein
MCLVCSRVCDQVQKQKWPHGWASREGKGQEKVREGAHILIFNHKKPLTEA